MAAARNNCFERLAQSELWISLGFLVSLVDDFWTVMSG
jgi:hypothetical protein